jgi:hypothetical protein
MRPDCLQTVINCLPNINREFGRASFVPFDMPTNGNVVTLHHERVQLSHNHFGKMNTHSKQKLEKVITLFDDGNAAINGIEKRLDFLSFQIAMGLSFILTSYESANTAAGLVIKRPCRTALSSSRLTTVHIRAAINCV